MGVVIFRDHEISFHDSVLKSCFFPETHVSRRGTAFWSQRYTNYRSLDAIIQDTFLKNTGDLKHVKGNFNDKYNKKKTFFL